VLLVLIPLHLVNQHFSGNNGLLTYNQVVAQLRNPVWFALETLLVATMLFHALAGIRAIMLDLGISGRREWLLNRGLIGVGVCMFAYGLVLTTFVVTR
jgi:succinate dehydrogenase hydrophobic anchor subunit